MGTGDRRQGTGRGHRKQETREQGTRERKEGEGKRKQVKEERRIGGERVRLEERKQERR